MRAVVIGGAGFLGSHIIDRLLRDNFEVVCIDQQGCNTAYLDSIHVPILSGNITDKESIKQHLQKGDLVFHIAAILGAARASWAAYEKVNVRGTMNAFDAALEKEANSFLFMSTYGVYGPHGSLEHPLTEEMQPQPYSHYDQSKYLGEKYIMDNATKGSMSCVIFRAPVIYGPRANPKSGTATVFHSLKRGLFAVFGNTKQKFSVCYVKNLANAFVFFAQKHRQGVHVYNMAHSPSGTLEDFLSEIGKYYSFRVLKMPASVGLFLAKISDAISKRTGTKPLVPMDLVLGLVSDAYNSSISKAIGEGYNEEYSIGEGVKETVESLK